RLLEREAVANPQVAEALSRLDAILPKNSKLRQSYFFADPEYLASTGASHLRPISPIERAARMGTADAPEELTPEQRARLKDLFPKLQAQRREASKTASELAQLLVPLLAQLESTAMGLEDANQREALQSFLGCLQSALISQTPSHSNVLAMRKLYLWLQEGSAPSELQESRLNFFSDQFGCSGDGISPGSLGWTSSSFEKPGRVAALGERLVQQLADETKLLEETDPLWTSAEAALIESDNLDRIREAQAREGALGGTVARKGALMKELQKEEASSQKKLAQWGLSSNTATQNPTSSLTAQDIRRLEQDHNIVYDPIRNALILTQQSKVDAKLLDLLSKAKNIDLIFQGAHESEGTLIADGANASSFLSFLARAGTQAGASPLSTALTWDQIRALDAKNPDGIPTPVWFPLTEETAVRMKLSADGKLTAEFSPVQKLAADARKKVDAIIEARSRSYLAQHNYQGAGHAFKSYFGAMAGWDPSQTTEAQELQASYNDYVQLRQALGQLGKIPVANGQGLTADQFRGNEIHEMRRLLNQEEEAIHKLLSKVETIHSLSVMVATLPLGAVSLPAKLVGPLAQIAQGTGRAAFAARNTLRTLQALNAIKTGYVAATKHGLITSTAFSGIDLLAEGIIHSFPNSTHHLIEEKIALGRKGQSWKKHPEHPGSDPKWGPRDSQGLPTDPEKRKAFLQAMFEFELEQSLDIDHNGVIDEIQGLHGEAVPFSRKRDFLSSVANFDRVQQFTDSAKFFRDLSLAKLPGPRFVALPLEMGFAGTLGEVSGTVQIPGLGPQQLSDFGFGRSRDSLRHEEKYREGGPRTDAQRLTEAFIHNTVEGARFGAAGASSNALMRTLGRTTPNAANLLMGTLLFTGIDASTRAGVSQAMHGYTGTEAANWEDWTRQFLQHNATSMYIGLGITRSGIQRAEHRRLQEVYLSGGAEALRSSLREQARKSKSDSRTLLSQLFRRGGDPQNAKVDPRVEAELMASVIASLRPQDLAQATPETRRGYQEFVESRLREANSRFQEVVRSGAVISPEGARRLVQINEELLQISREGAWNHSKRSAELLREQDGLFKELNAQLQKEHAALRAATVNLQRLAGSETPERVAEYQQQMARFEGVVNLIGGLSETLPQMAAARSLVTPALTMGAVTQPNSAFAQQHFSDKPAALQALQSFERSARQQVRSAAERVTQFLAEEHILPDFGRASDGQGEAARFTGARPTQGVNGRAQRESAELVERVLRSRTTSQQAK
ncbi:hypothetical protein EBR78_07545, partial [bacterium]|nr:hypothetical protein [bacterium]